MFKKVLTSTISTSLVLAMLAGCGGAPTVASSVAGSSAPDSGASTASGTPAELVTLKILGGFDGNINPAEDPVKKEIEERTGYLLEYSMLPQDNADEKLSLEITSGSDYDILMLTPDQFRTLAKQNALMDISELVKENGPTLQSVIPQDTWQLTTLDGKVYGIPQKNERPNIEPTLAMRKDMLDKANIATPTTLDEFYNALKTLKATYPDVTPLTHATNVFLPTIQSAFGLYTNWMEQDGKLVHMVTAPQTKDYLAFMTKLYNEGLLDRDTPVNKSANRDEKFTAGKAASMTYSWFVSDKIEPALKQNFPEAELILLDPLKGEGYDAGVGANVRFLKASAIPKSSRKAADAIKFMDKKLEWDNFLYLTLGTEGETFTKEGNKYAPIMPKFNETRSTGYYYLNGIDEKNYADMWLCRVRRNEYVGNTFELINKNFDQYAKYDPAAFMPAITSVSKYTASLNKMFEDYQMKLITGGEKIEDYDKFVAKWNEAGGAEMIKDVNEWYATTK